MAGRPRKPAARRDLQQAALRLVRRHGYAGVTISDIARAAGVSRQTLYARWDSKAELVLHAIFEIASQPDPDLSGPEPRRVLLENFLRAIFADLSADGDTLRGLIATTLTEPGFLPVFRARFSAPREAIMLALLHDARARGELPATADPELLSDFIHGAFWYRLLNGQPLPPDLAQRIAGAVFATPAPDQSAG
ncbi:TetR/AcrR family transcriptional regulator [Pseudooceanicola sp. CBS1P-1]|uniref:TetR family transcriptional regulator n=1 Tax=Pseudooceanicola albus TaxID=2692189 RepID=A0A6L7GCF4_9RHOB|nr:MULTISPECIES: TetR/AcrR family transcriptional regulator [Pseudooceanicola]MBT9386786.1 TetR/AcrR family transcriptional regulator [Pseudooceanicola endophyticus]MXN20956.1 TetR family transcriptional regulator [Pseudooceanicola albus]